MYVIFLTYMFIHITFWWCEDLWECDVKWALKSTVSKVSGCNEIPAELFRSLTDDAIKDLHSLCQIIWKTQHWKRSVLIPVPKKGTTKNVLTIKQLHSSLKLVWSYLKSYMLGFSIMQTKNFQMSSWVSKRKRN